MKIPEGIKTTTESLVGQAGKFLGVIGVGLSTHMAAVIVPQEMRADPELTVVEAARDEAEGYAAVGLLALGGALYFGRRQASQLAYDRLDYHYNGPPINTSPSSTYVPQAPILAENGLRVHVVTTTGDGPHLPVFRFPGDAA